MFILKMKKRVNKGIWRRKKKGEENVEKSNSKEKKWKTLRI